MFDIGGFFGLRRDTRKVSSDDEDKYDSFGPASLDYRVNMTPSPTQPAQQSQDEPAKSPIPPKPKNTRARSTSRGRSSQEDVMAKILEVCKQTQEDVTKIRSRLDQVVDEVADVKSKVTAVEERMASVEDGAKALTQRMEKIEQGVDELEKRVEERILKKLQDERSVMPTLYKPNFLPKQASFQSVKPSWLKPKTQPSFQPAGKIVHDAFKELLKAADARKQTFLVGVVEQITENGAQLRPRLKYDKVVQRFFEGVRYTVGPLGTAQSSGLPLGRVTVHPEDVHTMKIRARDNWRVVKDVGWWIGQENPADLRQMQINAIRFVMETKTVCNELRRFYVEVEDGFLRFQGAPFIPVYMVPTNKEKWPELANILLKILVSLRSLNWVDRFRKASQLRKVEPALVDEWNSVLRASEPEEALEDDEDEPEECVEVRDEDTLHGRLYHLGRSDRSAKKTEPKGSTDGRSDRTPVQKEYGDGGGKPPADMEMGGSDGDVMIFTSVYL
jgi:hypothetical protein